MNVKIAVPVSAQERQIHARTGMAPYFAVYVDGTFTELRPNAHAASHAQEGHGNGHGHGHGGAESPEPYSKEEVEHHRQDLGNLQDIDVILTRAVGPNMKEALESVGIKVVKIRKADGDTADAAIANYLGQAH